jgi:hypothetical protein
MSLKPQSEAWLDRIFKSIVAMAILGLVILLVGVFLVNKMFQDILGSVTNTGGTTVQQTQAKKN